MVNIVTKAIVDDATGKVLNLVRFDLDPNLDDEGNPLPPRWEPDVGTSLVDPQDGTDIGDFWDGDTFSHPVPVVTAREILVEKLRNTQRQDLTLGEVSDYIRAIEGIGERT